MVSRQQPTYQVPDDGHAKSSVVRKAAQLEALVANVLMAAGADVPNASRVAEALVSSNLCGVDTHGVWHVPGYVEWMKAGEIDPKGRPSILQETVSTALVSGGWTFGHVGAKFATEVLIQKAREHNIALVSLVQAGHTGRLGEYVEMAATAGLISMVWAGGFAEHAPAAVPYGGRKKVLHTNPIAMAFPADGTPSMMFDFATTALSGVKVHDARDKDQPLPPGSIVDRDGNPTTNPHDFFSGGAHAPFGAHKGYALMLAAEYLGLVFPGSEAYAKKPLGGGIFGGSGTTFVAMRADMFQSADQYAERSERLERRIREVPPAPGFQEVLLPGDLEARTRAIRLRDGIPIPESVWTRLTQVAQSLGITDY